MNFVKPLQLFVLDNSHKFLNQGGGSSLSPIKRIIGSFYNKYMVSLPLCRYGWFTKTLNVISSKNKHLLNNGNIAMKLFISDSNPE